MQLEILEFGVYFLQFREEWWQVGKVFFVFYIYFSRVFWFTGVFMGICLRKVCFVLFYRWNNRGLEGLCILFCIKGFGQGGGQVSQVGLRISLTKLFCSSVSCDLSSRFWERARLMVLRSFFMVFRSRLCCFICSFYDLVVRCSFSSRSFCF